jgi:predicted TIM-barrel fold metal-dependent hydrolase
MIIDCHCHAGRGDRMSGPWDTRADLTAYLQRCDAAGIGRSVVFAALAADYRAGNDDVAALLRAHRGRLLAFVFLDGRMSRLDVEREIEKHVLGNGFVGIKCHRHDAPISRAICELAARYQLPVLYDVGGEVASIELFATEYPMVNFIIPHLGSFADDWKAQLAIIDHVQRHGNVYTDTAGVRRFDYIADAIARAGAHKVLFGSDGPWLHPGVELGKIKWLGLNAAEYANVTGGNLLRLLGRRVRAAAAVTPVFSTRPPRSGQVSSAALFATEWRAR